jgi:hypothetical protein
MSTTIVTIPAGITQVLQAPARSSLCFQPAAGGSATVSYGPSGISPSFTTAIQSGNTSPFSLATDTYASVMGQVGQVQVTAAGGQACTVLISDISLYPGSFPERQTVAQSGVAYTMPTSTSELTLFSIRFPAGYLKANFRCEAYYQLTTQNSVNVKTIKAYFGPSSNSATAGALETSASALYSQVYTSMAGGYGTVAVTGRNDGQTIIGSNTGLTSAGGWGSSTTANVTVSNAAYLTTEQVSRFISNRKGSGPWPMTHCTSLD